MINKDEWVCSRSSHESPGRDTTTTISSFSTLWPFSLVLEGLCLISVSCGIAAIFLPSKPSSNGGLVSSLLPWGGGWCHSFLSSDTVMFLGLTSSMSGVWCLGFWSLEFWSIMLYSSFNPKTQIWFICIPRLTTNIVSTQLYWSIETIKIVKD